MIDGTDSFVVRPCFACGYSRWISRTGNLGTRIECDQCGVSLSGWCSDRDEARHIHLERSELFASAALGEKE